MCTGHARIFIKASLRVFRKRIEGEGKGNGRQCHWPRNQHNSAIRAVNSVSEILSKA